MLLPVTAEAPASLHVAKFVTTVQEGHNRIYPSVLRPFLQDFYAKVQVNYLILL